MIGPILAFVVNFLMAMLLAVLIELHPAIWIIYILIWLVLSIFIPGYFNSVLLPHDELLVEGGNGIAGIINLVIAFFFIMAVMGMM